MRSRSNSLFGLPPSVWLLGWVSLATDASSEAIYALLPFFLTQVLGASAISLGIVEGAAEAVNSVLKVMSGRAADRPGHKRPLVLAGYSISSFTRPLMAFARTWPHVFIVRVVDRVGKGIRGAPRDALLAIWATPNTRGKIYGFHRAMDHTGAVIGPVLATVFLFFYPGHYRTLFGLTVIPGLVAVLLILLVREDRDIEQREAGVNEDPAPRSAIGKVPAAAADSAAAGDSRAGDKLPRELTAFFAVLALFTLGNSSDAFLLLKLTDVAGSATYIPLMWAALHVVKASVSIVGGSWSDRIGRRSVIVAGWTVYAIVYIGFATAGSLRVLLAWFLLYGFYFGFAEGTEKALIADLSPASKRGFAFGIYTAVQGVGALVASVLFGALWTAFGSAVAFGTGAALALGASVLLFVVVSR